MKKLQVISTILMLVLFAIAFTGLVIFLNATSDAMEQVGTALLYAAGIPAVAAMLLVSFLTLRNIYSKK